MKNITILLIFTTLISCVPTGNSRVPTSVSIDDNLTTCTDSYFVVSEGNVCQSACTTDQSVATSTEINSLLNSTEITEEIKEIIRTSKGVCLDAPLIDVRPSNAVFIKSEFCVCKSGKVATIGADPSCTNTCSQKTNDFFEIFGSVSVGAEIEGNTKYKNLNGWCTTQIDNNQASTPACSIVLTNDSNETTNINLTTYAGTNNFYASLSSLFADNRYKFILQETGTKIENAKSDMKQFHLTEPDDGSTDYDDDLHVMPIDQYTCIYRFAPVNTATGANMYEAYSRFHYYKQTIEPIQPLGPGAATSMFCHDYTIPGRLNDMVSYPRLENVPGHFAVWDNQDSRFTKTGNNMEIDYILQEKVRNMGVSNPTLKSYFGSIGTCTAPDSAETLCIGPTEIGFAMAPFVDKGISFCPNETHYEDQTKPELVALGEVLGKNPTEGLYYGLGERITITATDSNGSVTTKEISRDMVLIRETELKSIWFHYDSNGVPIKPTTATERQATYFYWPVVPGADPLIKKEGFQRLYTVQSASEISSGQRTDSTVPTTAATHDRKAFCIPKR